ncbi:MAG: hypothetical protein Q4B81_00285 [Moraxella sp.]|nr:hypothetical protein [Moraxella sp.]
MTKTTDVPNDLSAYAKTQAFIDVSTAYKSDEIRTKLDELGAGYLASDNKTELVYRLLSAQGMLPILSDDDDDYDDVIDDEDNLDLLEADSAVVDDSTAAQAQAADDDADAVVVESVHYRSLLEPATGTLILPQTHTVIRPTAYVSRERILDNLRQISLMHRDMLKIVGVEE